MNGFFLRDTVDFTCPHCGLSASIGYTDDFGKGSQVVLLHQVPYCEFFKNCEDPVEFVRGTLKTPPN